MTTSVAEAGQRLLQDDQPFDVAVLDGIVAAAYEPRHPERATANEILMKLREKPGCWQAADQIIEKSSLPQGRYFGLMALDDAINTRWKILPEGQRTGIKNFIVNKIISLSKDEESSMRERTMIHQMNKVRSPRFEVLRCLHAIDATRVHLTMKWVVSFSSLRPFGPRRATATRRAGPRLDPQAGVAPQLAVVHRRHLRRVEEFRDPLREQHAHPAAAK
jgi:hypothetical protein